MHTLGTILRVSNSITLASSPLSSTPSLCFPSVVLRRWARKLSLVNKQFRRNPIPLLLLSILVDFPTQWQRLVRRRRMALFETNSLSCVSTAGLYRAIRVSGGCPSLNSSEIDVLAFVPALDVYLVFISLLEGHRKWIHVKGQKLKSVFLG